MRRANDIEKRLKREAGSPEISTATERLYHEVSSKVTATARFHRVANNIIVINKPHNSNVQKHMDSLGTRPSGQGNNVSPLVHDRYSLSIKDDSLGNIYDSLDQNSSERRNNTSPIAYVRHSTGKNASEMKKNGPVLPHHRCKRGTPLLEEGKHSCNEIYFVFQNMELKKEYFSSSQEEYVAKLWEEVDSKLVSRSSKFEANILTKKYNNPPLRRVPGTTKNAHLSMLEIVGTGDNNFFPFFLIFSTLFISSPCGGSPEGKGGLGTVTNNFKPQVAYET